MALRQAQTETRTGRAPIKPLETYSVAVIIRQRCMVALCCVQHVPVTRRLCSAAVRYAHAVRSVELCMPACRRDASGDSGGQPSETRLPAPHAAARQHSRDGRGDGGQAEPDGMRRRQPPGGAAAREPAQQSTAAVASAAAAGGNLSVAAALRARLKVHPLQGHVGIAERRAPWTPTHDGVELLCADQAMPSSGLAPIPHQPHHAHASIPHRNTAAIVCRGLQGQPQPEPSAKPRAEVVVLPTVDARGRALPGAHGREAAGADLPDNGALSNRTDIAKGSARIMDTIALQNDGICAARSDRANMVIVCCKTLRGLCG